jgi:hypothetical protein
MMGEREWATGQPMTPAILKGNEDMLNKKFNFKARIPDQL